MSRAHDQSTKVISPSLYNLQLIFRSTGTIAERAAVMNEFLTRTLEKNAEINFLAHSMGGLDCRHLITHMKPTHYRPISLTTLSTPHRGSSFMDFCRDYLGLGRISS